LQGRLHEANSVRFTYWIHPHENTIHSSLIAGLLLFTAAGLRAQGTAFTYDGKLNDGAGPANGLYDLRFTLYNAVTNGSAAGSLTNTATASRTACSRWC